MSGSTVTVRLSSEEKALITDYARTLGVSVSEFVRSAAMERIEGVLDLKVWEDAKAEYEEDRQTYSAAEVSARFL